MYFNKGPINSDSKSNITIYKGTRLFALSLSISNRHNAGIKKKGRANSLNSNIMSF